METFGGNEGRVNQLSAYCQCIAWITGLNSECENFI